MTVVILRDVAQEDHRVWRRDPFLEDQAAITGHADEFFRVRLVDTLPARDPNQAAVDVFRELVAALPIAAGSRLRPPAGSTVTAACRSDRSEDCCTSLDVSRLQGVSSVVCGCGEAGRSGGVYLYVYPRGRRVGGRMV